MASKDYEKRLAELQAMKEANIPYPSPVRDEKGRIVPGSSLNPEGKKKGVKNKWNKELKLKLQNALRPFLTNEAIQADLKALDPLNRIKAIDIYLKWAEIRGKGLNGSGKVENNITFEVTYSEEYKRRKKNSKTIDITPDEYKVMDDEDEEG